jgi:alpha-beta hydrolase superfamily lysophospholipase
MAKASQNAATVRRIAHAGLLFMAILTDHANGQSPALERNVSIPGGAAPLHGTLLVPSGNAPAALILAGSGPTDRDGNQPTAHSDTLKMLAHALFARGIATLRVDKRGIAASGLAAPSEVELRLDTYVADAKAWLEFLRTQERIDRLFIIGHSEGALIATLVAPGEKLTGLVLIAAIGSPFGNVLRRQLAAAAIPASLRQKAFEIMAALQRRERVRDVPSELAALFRPSVQPFMISLLELDPVTALGASTIPALVAQGTNDLQVSIEDARLLAASRPGVALTIIEGMNHTLKMAPADRAAQMHAYTDPDLPLSPTLAPTIANFILATH